MNITQFTMEEVRCFGESQKLEIRPLTFLVGENSTGKTTVLACFHMLANYFCREGVDFNLHPYSMGTFKDIVRNSTKKGRAFSLGFTCKYKNENLEWTVEFVKKKGGIEPAVSSVTAKLSDGEIIFQTNENAEWPINLAHSDEERNQYRIDCSRDILERPSFDFFLDFLKDITSRHASKGRSKEKNALAKYLESRENSESSMYGPWNIGYNLSVFSTSAIRSRPKRTYDPTREFNDPEGSDVPMLLMRTEATQKADWESLKMQLIEFGKSSGLFQNIQIKNIGRSLGAPFQLNFKVRGPSANIVDVGYGVSQILPILVHILHSNIPRRTRLDSEKIPFFLLQQPEVHLHPKAQAELSSLLAKSASKDKRSFIVETHSDYMIDRARVEIRKGNIDHKDVSLIYFEPKANIVRVHNIRFDKIGNMEGVPPYYREFFLKESDRLMGFED